jgi:outer membrane protein OmpA-like peptidoglycan-associated protein
MVAMPAAIDEINRPGQSSSDRLRDEGGPQPIQRRGAALPGKRSRSASYYGEAVAQRKPAEGTSAPAAPAASGGGRPLPAGVRADMESFLGIDLAAVRIHEDGQAAAAGAQAFTRGTDIHFAPGKYDPDSASGRELLGHELAHVAQQTRGQVQATVSVNGLPVNDDAALEREADDIGARAARGGGGKAVGDLAPATPGSGIAQRRVENLNGNPADRTDTSGNPTTSHKSPGIGDAVNAPPAPTAAENEARTTSVKVIAGEGNPLHLPTTVCADRNRVYQESASAASPAPAGFTTVSNFAGTFAAPQVTQEANKSLYINNQPTAADVQQGGVGDCFGLATLMSVVSRDPGKVKSMIAPDGNGGGSVTFWRMQQHPPTIWDRIRGSAGRREWIQVAVSVNDQLAFNVGPGGRIHGAQLRCATQPKEADHWAKIAGSTLEVHRKDIYECARWAPIFEKAWARFAQAHDTYGGAASTGRAAPPASGYDAINGGASVYSLAPIYGPAYDDPANAVKYQGISWTPGGNSVTANAAVMDQLVLLQGRGNQAAPGDTNAPVLMASAHVDELIGRLALAIPAAQADPDWVNVDATRQGAVGTVATSITTWQPLPPDPALPAAQPKALAKRAIGNACVQAVRPGIDESAGEQGLRDRFNRNNPGTIRFPMGNDAVPAAEATALGRLNQDMRTFTHPQVAVKLDGHASAEGSDADNQALSQRRVDNVETALLTGGAFAPHTTAKTAHGEAGATLDASWRKVDVTIEPTGHRSNSLLDPARSAPIRGMADLMLDLRNIGTDNSPGQRNIYGDHAYSVVAVNIVDAAGAQVALSGVAAGARAPLYATVDAGRSTVTLRNPHHGNEPDRRDNGTPSRPGDGAPSGRDSDGTFTMSLDEFFRNFNAVHSGVFPRT